MSRARNIKPGFFKNDVLADCQPLARLLFAGLWCEADREGRLDDRPKRIKAECLPYDDCDVNCLLNELSEHGFILRYTANDQPYIQILAFGKHQNPHCKEQASTIPAPCMHGASIEHAGLIPDSLNLIPDSPSRKPQKPLGHRADDPGAFESKFWPAYPRKAAKASAAKAFAKINPDDALLGRMLAALERERRSDQWQREAGRFIPHAATWLNQRRWEDEAQPTNEFDPASFADGAVL